MNVASHMAHGTYQWNVVKVLKINHLQFQWNVIKRLHTTCISNPNGGHHKFFSNINDWNATQNLLDSELPTVARG